MKHKGGPMSKNYTAAIVSVILLVALIAVGYHDYKEEPIVTECPAEKVCPVATNTTTDSLQIRLDTAYAYFIEEVEDNEKYHFCNGHEYDFNDISKSKVYTEYNLHSDDEDTSTDTINVKLKYTEDGKNCFKNYEASVFYDEDENPEVTIK